MFRFLFSLFVLITSLQAKILNPTTHTLKNGLQVVVVKNKMAPVISLGVLYKIGTADDPASEVGLSHFLEHMMFKGTKKFKENAYAENIKKMGGSHNAYTSYDLTHYISDFPKTGLPLVLEMEADRMTNLNFSNEKDLIPEQKVVHQERLMRMENTPFTEAIEAYLKACYWYHPYGVPPIGYPHHIDAYTYDSVMNHYKKWYGPNNAFLIIVGDVDEKEGVALAEKYFGQIKPISLPKRVRPQEPDHNGVTTTVRQLNKRSANTIIQYNYKTPAFHKMEKGEFEALLVLEHILSGSDTSPIYQDLVIDQKLALDVGMSGVGLSIDDSYVDINATLSPEQSLKKLELTLGRWLKTFMTSTINSEHITRAKNEITKPKIFIKDNRTGIRKIFDDLAYGRTVDEIITEDERINKVTLEQVKAVYTKYLTKKPEVVLRLLPQQKKSNGTQQANKNLDNASFFHRIKSLFVEN